MSDFDKEAEREKLRKKYEQDQKDREATQRMSDLLLKGARMTNTHCDVCGDPLFEQNETIFCPSCHGGPEGVDAAVSAPTESDDSASESVETADAASTAVEPAEHSQDTTPTAPADVATESTQETTHPAADSTSNQTSSRSEPQTAAPSRTQPHARGDLERAHDSLVVSLERFAQKAADADDPRYATACLEAAHEAAETLAVLEAGGQQSG